MIFGQSDAEKLKLLLLKSLLFLYQSDIVVSQLPKFILLIRFIQREVLRNVSDFPGDLSEYLLTGTKGIVEHTNPHQTPLIDIRVHCSRRDQVEDGDGLAFLPFPIDTSDSLFNPHRIPRKIIIHNAIAELVVQAFAANLRKQKNIKTFILVPLHLETIPKLDTIFIRGPPVANCLHFLDKVTGFRGQIQFL